MLKICKEKIKWLKIKTRLQHILNVVTTTRSGLLAIAVKSELFAVISVEKSC